MYGELNQIWLVYIPKEKHLSKNFQNKFNSIFRFLIISYLKRQRIPTQRNSVYWSSPLIWSYSIWTFQCLISSPAHWPEAGKFTVRPATSKMRQPYCPAAFIPVILNRIAYCREAILAQQDFWYLDISWSHIYIVNAIIIITICSFNKVSFRRLVITVTMIGSIQEYHVISASELNNLRAFATKPIPRDNLPAMFLIRFFHVKWLST